MKRKISILSVMFILTSLFYACNKDSDEIAKTQNPEIEYKTLSPSEIVLKNQLADAAIIIAEIASDQSVLDEIVATIKSQPRIMEDRVKFADLMKPIQQLKSGNTNFKTGSFALAFKNKLSTSGLKSTTGLIESLTSQGVEVYIPYPIEDYPKGTDIVITSFPLDNIYENDGYFIGKPNKKVKANDELAKKNPVIIVTTPLYSDEKLQQMSANRANMDQMIATFNEGNLKSANTLDPMANWYNESKSIRFGVYIPKIYCTNDHVTGLFGIGDMYIIGGTVSFDTSTKIVFSGTMDTPGFGFALPRKYEGYAQQGWSKGWFDCNVFLFVDWNPAITKNTLSIFMDTPNMSTTLGGTLTASWLQKATSTGMELSKSLGASATASTTFTTRDFLYGTSPWLRERYKTDYYSPGEAWGEIGERTINVPGFGERPAISFSTELKYVTYCQVW